MDGLNYCDQYYLSLKLSRSYIPIGSIENGNVFVIAAIVNFSTFIPYAMEAGDVAQNTIRIKHHHQHRNHVRTNGEYFIEIC